MCNDQPSLLRRLDGNVLVLTLHRPTRNNAWNRDLEESLHAQLFAAAKDREIRAIVLTGHGRMFCPGADSDDLTEFGSSGRGYETGGRHRSTLLTIVPKPVITAINGGCAGVGLALALMTDIRFAADEATISPAFSRRGLPAEEAISWFLPRIIGHAAALELLLSSRPIKGPAAASLGMVHRSLPRESLMPTVLEYAHDLVANCSPRAMADIKRQIYLDWECSMEDSRRESRRLVANAFKDPDFVEGVQSFLEQRSPSFQGYAASVELDTSI
jgi:enoyl-CoA hydratase/carnithine racemase